MINFSDRLLKSFTVTQVMFALIASRFVKQRLVKNNLVKKRP